MTFQQVQSNDINTLSIKVNNEALSLRDNQLINQIMFTKSKKKYSNYDFQTMSFYYLTN